MRLLSFLSILLFLSACTNSSTSRVEQKEVKNPLLFGTWKSSHELFTISENGFYQNRASNGTVDYGAYQYDGNYFSLQVYSVKHDVNINPTFQVVRLSKDTFTLSNGNNAWSYHRINSKQLSKHAQETVWTKKHEYYIYGTWQSDTGATLIFDDFSIMQSTNQDSTYIGCYAILGDVINFECRTTEKENFYRMEIMPEQTLKLTNIVSKTEQHYSYLGKPKWKAENQRIAAPYAIDSPDKRIYFFKNKARIGRLVEVYKIIPK